jgi:hypothetical protein
VSVLREQVLAALSKFQPKAVEMPALGGTIYVRPLTVAGMARVHAMQTKAPDRVPALMLIDCLCDESGKRIFTDEDEQQVADLPGTIADQLLTVIGEMSDLSAKGTQGAAGN